MSLAVADGEILSNVIKHSYAKTLLKRKSVQSEPNQYTDPPTNILILFSLAIVSRTLKSIQRHHLELKVPTRQGFI